MQKPHAPSCDRNQEPILQVLRETFAETTSVLEVGSGTGQHGVYFAGAMPHLQWHTSDLAVNHEGIRAWVTDANLSNLTGPRLLDVGGKWDVPAIDGVFTANTLHIMGWDLGQKFLAKSGECLPKGGTLCVYGPFNYGGNFTSASNAQFQIWLQNRSPECGIRDFEAVEEHANKAGLSLVQDYEMPANNRLLHFRKN